MQETTNKYLVKFESDKEIYTEIRELNQKQYDRLESHLDARRSIFQQNRVNIISIEKVD